MMNDIIQNGQALQQQGLVSPQMANQVAQQAQQFQQMPQPAQREPLQQGEGQVISVECKSNGANAQGEPWQKYSVKVADAMQQGKTLTYSKFAKMINGQWEVMPQMGQYIDFAYSVKANPRNVQFPYKTIMRWSQKQQTPQLQQPPQTQPVQAQGAPYPQQVQPPQGMQPIPPQPQSQPMPQGTYQNQGGQIMQVIDSDITGFKTSYLLVAQQKGITPEENHFLGTYIKNKMPTDPTVMKILSVFRT